MNKSFMLMKKTLHSLKRTKTILSIQRVNFSDDKIKIVKGLDPKNFGKKFTPQEMEKLLDPFGFLGAEEYNKVKKELSDKQENNNETKEEVNISASVTEQKPVEPVKETIVEKLENLEKIVDRAKKADEKCKIMPTEYGYKYNGPEPTRYGDWDVKGKCVDF